MRVGSLGYRTDLALLRLGGTIVREDGDVLVVTSPQNPTSWWGNFLLAPGVPDAEGSAALLHRFAATFPYAAHVALGFDGVDGQVSDLAWFTEQGFRAEAQTVCTTRAVHPPRHRNPEATYRGLASESDWAQSVELRMRCNDDNDPRRSRTTPADHRRFVTAKVATNRQLAADGHGQWFGAFLGEDLAAQMGLFATGEGLARFQSVETDPAFRRQGLAGSLLHHASRYGFDVLRAHTLVIVADPDYFALDLYRAVGFAATETQLQIERPPPAGRVDC